MGKLRSILLTTICKWATSNLLWLYWQMSRAVCFFSNVNRLWQEDREATLKVFSSTHLANAFVWNLGVIQQSRQLPLEWRVTGVRAWRLYYSCLGSEKARLWWERRDSSETWQCINLSVCRSTEVKRFPDPLTHRSDLTSLYIAWAHDKGTADRWKEGIKEQAAVLMFSLSAWLNVSSILWFHMCVCCLNVLCKWISRFIGR